MTATILDFKKGQLILRGRKATELTQARQRWLWAIRQPWDTTPAPSVA